MAGQVRYTRKQFIDFLVISIFKPILTEYGYPGTIIIKENQNAPAPSGRYLSVPYSAVFTPIGKSEISSPITEDGGLTYFRYRTTHYEVSSFDIKEINGDGDLLDILSEGLRTFKYKELMKVNGVGLKESGTNTAIPEKEGEDWLKMSVKELQFHTAAGLIEEIGIIEHIEYSGTINTVPEKTISGTIPEITGG